MKLDLIRTVILGILQGVTEFIPVSSSGHLLIMRNIMGVGEIPKLFDVLMHLPTLLAILIVFRKIIIRLFLSLGSAIQSVFTKKKIDSAVHTDLRLILTVIIATIPIVLFGILFDDLESFFDHNTRYVGILLIITGIILLCTKLFKGLVKRRPIGIGTGIIIGIAQGFGVLPGISRSGITIAASLLSGIKQEDASEFSFLIAVPAIIGAFFYKLKDAVAMEIAPFDLAAGLIVCFFVGLGSLLFLIRLVQTGKFYLFSVYLIPVGILTLIFL
ncbi:MAG: undecaprenyl-diphosphate phosphatase [Spirochaetales bacterium]|nr:undecaprenyl-diphosphate phosphatase [Spirochaetales bacterium]